MEPTILKFIVRHSAREQVALLVMTVAAFPFLYLSLDLPKTIVNEAIGGSEFPRELLGHSLDQIPYLLVLSTVFLALVLVNGAFKYVINVYRGVVGERMLRRLRYQLYENVLRFPLPHFRKLSQGEIVSMVTGETEPLGGYIGDAVALPAFQGGTLLTILVFMFVQDPVLGAAAVALYPIQAYLIPKLQRRINALKKERVVHVRKLSERIGETVNGIHEVHAHDTARFELADYAERIGEIYRIRYQMYVLKFFVKFLNNFIAQITPFFFYAIGGYLVITGDLSFGALVAVLAAYKDLSSPWKELLDFYQTKEDARVKYELLYESFQPPGLLDPSLRRGDLTEVPRLSGVLRAVKLDVREDADAGSGHETSMSFRVEMPARVALVGGSGSGRKRLATIIGAVRRPHSGSLLVSGVDLARAPQMLTGARIAYVGQDPKLRAGTLRDNLFYVLKHRPITPASYDSATAGVVAARLRDARLAGNSEDDTGADWIDYADIGVDGRESLEHRALEALTIADMADDTFALGLQAMLDPAAHPSLVERALQARAELRHRLDEPELAGLVEPFDPSVYNTNMSVAENLVFGTPRDDALRLDDPTASPYVLRVLDDTGLTDDFVEMGRSVAQLMVELFADIEPGSELVEQFSFISGDDLPQYKSLLARIPAAGATALGESDRRMLMALAFRITPARHRLGLIDAAMQDRLLAARELFARGFGDDAARPAVDFFDAERFNPAVSLQDNVLFGRLVYGKPRSAVRVGAAVREVVEKLGMREAVIAAGLDFSVGVGGSRLSPSQRQKVGIARAVLKRPDIMVVDEATAVLDGGSQERVLENLFREMQGRTLIWLVQHASLARRFERVIVLEDGHVVEEGEPQALDRPDTVFGQLVAAH